MAKIIYSDDLPIHVGGRCYYPILPKWGTCTIVIRPKYKEDKGILNHELCHEKQYKRSFWHGIKTMLYSDYRYECELEAYTEQIREYNYTDISQAQWIVDSLLFKYNLDIEEDEIIIDIKKILDGVA